MTDSATNRGPRGAEQAHLPHELRRFAPPAGFQAAANVTEAAYREADADRLGFWAERARRLTWATPFTEVLDWTHPPFAKWFQDGTLNVAVNCLDRHVAAGLGERVAYFFEGEPGDTRTITYAELTEEVCRAANALEALGLRAGDRVAIYLPMIPEAVVAMLACARIGAVHTVVFGGFSSHSLATRIQDCDARLVITADGGYRRGTAAALKPAVDEALLTCPGVKHVLLVRRTGQEIDLTAGRDVEWRAALDAQPATHDAQAFPAEHPLYVMYTSGGYLTGVSWTQYEVFDLKPETDVYWTAADIGWVTGHSYVVYGPLSNATTSVLYEGTPDTPHQGRWWEIVDKYRVTTLYCAPTAIRTFMKWGHEIPARYDLSSLRLLGSVGEPINPAAYTWYRTQIGHDAVPVVDTWWQTETGSIMISALPGVTVGKPGAAQRALPGIVADVVDDSGASVADGEAGYLVIREPWPSMLCTILGDDQRYVDTYWSRFPGSYFAGDGALKDEDGEIWLQGRVDDVMNVSGHRLSTAEIESALVGSRLVAEAAVVGATDATTGQAVVAFVILRHAGAVAGDAVVDELRAHVAQQIGKIARPRQIFIVPELPKTRSGKIMRRLLRDVAENRQVGDVTTLADSSVMDTIAAGMHTAPQED